MKAKTNKIMNILGRILNTIPTPCIIDYSRFVSVATVRGSLDSALYVNQAMKRAGIHSVVKGSVLYDVSVAPEDMRRAISVLNKGRRRKKYHMKHRGFSGLGLLPISRN
jgi:hypothetical protein